MLKRLISATFLLALSLSFAGICRADAPDWLRALAKQPVKSYADDVNMVILLEDQVTTVKENGDIIKTGRRAVRILRPEGRNFAASFGVGYRSNSKVNYLRSWSITSKGQEYETKSGDVVEQTVSSYEVYSQARGAGPRSQGPA